MEKDALAGLNAPACVGIDSFSPRPSFDPVSVPLLSHQILEAVTMQHIFMNNFQLCSEINERVVQHFVHCIETHGRNVQYIKFLQTIVKAEGKFIKKCQDMVMAEVTAMYF